MGTQNLSAQQATSPVSCSLTTFFLLNVQGTLHKHRAERADKGTINICLENVKKVKMITHTQKSVGQNENKGAAKKHGVYPCYVQSV